MLTFNVANMIAGIFFYCLLCMDSFEMGKESKKVVDKKKEEITEQKKCFIMKYFIFL